MSTALAERSSTLPKAVADRGLDEPQWSTLLNSLFPGAKPESVLMVVDYCRARKLDPMKKPCHIVPIKVKDAKSGEWVWRDVVMPGIYEHRTTAMRTGLYLGHSKPEYGPDAEMFGVRAPEWCEMTVYRRASHGERIEFPVRVYFREVCKTRNDGKANDRWATAPIQMLTKCTEAAGLREGFPDEIGGESTAEEMEGQTLVIDEPKAIQQPQRKSEASTQPASSQPPAAGDTPAAATEGVAILEVERRRAPSGTNFWIVLGDRHENDFFFLPESGEAWEQLVKAVTDLKGTGRRVEFDTQQPEGQKFPTIIGITPIGGQA